MFAQVKIHRINTYFIMLKNSYIRKKVIYKYDMNSYNSEETLSVITNG